MTFSGLPNVELHVKLFNTYWEYLGPLKKKIFSSLLLDIPDLFRTGVYLGFSKLAD